ncbi:hypothetical protein J6590_032468 [Homalodisca vitripennis]|nr:hypothetical protein J6590_032468 [Homalodisca vitripennis]
MCCGAELYLQFKPLLLHGGGSGSGTDIVVIVDSACGWFLLSLAPNITGTGPVPQCHGTGRRKDELNF